MPCSDALCDPEEERSYAKEVQRRLRITTRLACELCTFLEQADEDIPSYATKWWEQHKKEDKERNKQ